MIFVGDIHIDKTFPFTNKKTADRWRSLQDQTLRRIFKGNNDCIQVGDLFDNFMVSAADFMRGYAVADSCRWLIRGNHDVSNNTEQLSALQLLGDITSLVKIVVWDDVECWAAHGINYVMVPHQRTQQLFESALDRAFELTSTEIPNVLLLHCNVGDQPGTNTENHLRSDKIPALLSKFTFVVSGHDHNTRQPAQGLRMTGSILPMTFGEMTDKFVWKLEAGGPLQPIKVWDADENFKAATVQDFLALPVDTPLQFIQIDGVVDLSESVLISKKIADWYLHSETIIAIKNNTSRMEREVDDVSPKSGSLDWIAEVSKQMNDAEREIFMELLNGAQE